MDETANQMSDVRERLINALGASAPVAMALADRYAAIRGAAGMTANQGPGDGRLYTLVACSGCGNGYPVRYLARLEDGRYLCRSCFDAWTEDEQ